jgi:hypothetical protein
MQNSEEYTAEIFSAYRYRGAFLKENCPKEYEFLRTKVFSEEEFI